MSTYAVLIVEECGGLLLVSSCRDVTGNASELMVTAGI